MEQNGVKSRVGESDLKPARGGRIALEHGFELLFDGAKHTASMDSDQKGRNMMLSLTRPASFSAPGGGGWARSRRRPSCAAIAWASATWLSAGRPLPAAGRRLPRAVRR